MGQNVNIGGDRLGSGAKMNVELHNYYRSTHNLSKKFQSSLAPGLLYPAYVNVGLNGDKFDIDIETITRTLPTQGPLFGAFKMQIDAFVAPIRLYHGVLHNNPINIGLKMKDVILPKFKLLAPNWRMNKQVKQIHESNLWKYLGMSGVGLMHEELQPDGSGIANRSYSNLVRKVNAVPLLAYYDIFKNYYANKQEERFFYVRQGNNITPNIATIKVNDTELQDYYITFDIEESYRVEITGTNLKQTNKIFAEVTIGDGKETFSIPMSTLLYENNSLNVSVEILDVSNNKIIFNIQPNVTAISLYFNNAANIPSYDQKVTLTNQNLEDIDKMRENLLSIKLGQEYVINEEEQENGIYLINGTNYLPNEEPDDVVTLNQPLVGLVTKTYQSDLFNNWIKSETIDGENGIGAITRIDTSNGLELDTLNLAQKVYNMLNRIAVSGGTYEDWQSAVYSYETIRKAETPMYVGGYSCEIMFDEVISTASTETQEFKQQSLGSIGGRGRQVKEKGGHIKFEIEEPSIIMILVSLTPRITYSQGNKWFLTEIDSIDDLHKPALDGIGYQDLLVEQMAYTGTTINPDGTVREKLSAGKTVAWINYMTDVNECYGDFAAEEGKAYMVLNRNYDIVKENGELQAPTDITTYIDPAKFNYAFTYNELQAQNFWTEIQFNVTARRLMSAKQIPNL